jgi:hypothetical protein
VLDLAARRRIRVLANQALQVVVSDRARRGVALVHMRGAAGVTVEDMRL